MDKGRLNGQMVGFILEIMIMIKSMGMASFYGQMAGNIKDYGKMGNNMEG